MNKILLIFSACVLSVTFYSQDNSQIKYVYHKSTQNSFEELKSLSSNNKMQYKKALIKYNELSDQGKVILSTKEYAPIKNKIDESLNSKSSNISAEEIQYAEEASQKYILISEIIKQ